jgi:hypothetical protein
MARHKRDNYYVVGEGVLTWDHDGNPVCQRPSTAAALRKFRFSRLGPKGELTDAGVRGKLAEAMTAPGNQPDSEGPSVPAGFTYLAQFVDHDLTMDKTAVALGDDVTVGELLQGRSPALDLDSLYGRGPRNSEDKRFYAADGVHLKTGATAPVGPASDPVTNQVLQGFDLPRVGSGSTKAARRAANIPDPRNDENLAVAQTHLAFIRFHNRVVDTLATGGTPAVHMFDEARETVVRHYQWMLRTDFLPRLVDPAIVEDVFRHGRKYVDVPMDGDDPYGYLCSGDRRMQPGDTPTMPVEFSIAAYRLGHSMVRGVYQWNRVFNSGGAPAITAATLQLLFQFSGTSGLLSPGPLDLADPNAGAFEVLPSNWVADFRRLYDFGEAGRADLVVPAAQANVAKRIDTLVVDPLRNLPLGSFGARGVSPVPTGLDLNLAFRNLTRANMVHLASGQQMAELLDVKPLEADEILEGAGGAVLDALDEDEKAALVENTPLWFYVLREAELAGGRMTGVGGRIVAEVFHRAMEGSRTSIVRDPGWRPTLGPDAATFRMVDLLLFAFEGRAELLNPLG